MSRKLILLMSVSMDGFAGHSDGSLDWLTPKGGPDHGGQRHRINVEAMAGIGLIAFGGGVYPDLRLGWAESDSPMGRRINELPKLVFSQSLEAVDWDGATISRRPVAEHIPELKAEGDGDIVVFGGVRFANGLIRERLVDEYRLTVHPVLLGEGQPLFAGQPEPQRLELVSSTVYADGSLMQVMRPNR